jgi:hypothetical protein
MAQVDASRTLTPAARDGDFPDTTRNVAPIPGRRARRANPADHP